MKKLILAAFLFAVAVTLQAQDVKILFDATKAETAGNADWVIDADQHNLGYNSGPAVPGQGNESNAQQIPSPAQSSVTQSTSETYWEGGISAWGIDLVKKGYTVESLPYNGSITYNNSGNAQDLKNYKVFVVCEPNIVFTAAEKTAIILFVQNGGGLFMVSDHDVSDRNNDGWDSPHIWNDLISNNSIKTDPFGMTFDYADFSQTSGNIPSLPNDPLLHGIMGNVTKVQWSNGTTMTLTPGNNPTVKGVVYKTGSSFGNTNVMVAYSSYGTGKVAAIGDSSPCDDGTGDPNDQLYTGWTGDASGNHERLIMNATLWLATDSSVGIIEGISIKQPSRLQQNPVGDELIIETGNSGRDGNSQVTVLNLEGKTLIENSLLNEPLIRINVSTLPAGLYFYRLLGENQSVVAGKFIKN